MNYVDNRTNDTLRFSAITKD